MNKDEIEDNLRVLLDKVKPLPYVLRKLQDTDISFGIFAGSSVALWTGYRSSTDVDFLVSDKDIYLLKEIFPFAKTTERHDGKFLYIGKNDEIEFVAEAYMENGDHSFPYRLTESAANRIKIHDIDGLKIPIADPVDTIIAKAILRRGKDQGKHDLEDIDQVIKAVKIDKEYLTLRLKETKSTEFTKEIWQKHSITD